MSTPSRRTNWALVGVGFAFGVIFSGVLLHLFTPKGEPLAPPPASGFAEEHEHELEPIPPEYFDEEGADPGESSGAEPL